MDDLEDPSDIATCADCGSVVSQFESYCPLSNDDVLCWDCAIRRGGTYDVVQGRWSVMPDVTGLRRESASRPSHAP